VSFYDTLFSTNALSIDFKLTLIEMSYPKLKQQNIAHQSHSVTPLHTFKKFYLKFMPQLAQKIKTL